MAEENKTPTPAPPAAAAAAAAAAPRRGEQIRTVVSNTLSDKVKDSRGVDEDTGKVVGAGTVATGPRVTFSGTMHKFIDDHPVLTDHLKGDEELVGYQVVEEPPPEEP